MVLIEMSRRNRSELAYLAPGASQTAPSTPAKVWLPGAVDGAAEVPSANYHHRHHQETWPAPDEHLVPPETGHEMLNGQVVEVAPADAPHADQQCDLAYVLRAHVAPGYVASTELLTRVAEESNFSTDACIRREGLDAQGHRYLEELSFEVQHTQSEASLTERAIDLQKRGVRRVIAIEVKMASRGRVQAGPVKEWLPSSHAQGSAERDGGNWRRLAMDELLKDPCLQRPIKVAALVDAEEADIAVARALLERQNPVLLAVRTQDFDKGHKRGFSEGYEQGFDKGVSSGHRDSIEALCEVLGIALTPTRRAKLDNLNSDETQRLMRHLRTNKTWDENLD